MLNFEPLSQSHWWKLYDKWLQSQMKRSKYSVRAGPIVRKHGTMIRTTPACVHIYCPRSLSPFVFSQQPSYPLHTHVEDVLLNCPSLRLVRQ